DEDDDDEENFTIGSDFIYVWNIHPEKIIDIPLISFSDEKNQVFTNEEKFSIEYDETFCAEIKHTTSFILQGHLTLSVFGLIGYEYSNESDEQTSLFGFSTGLSGSLMY
ncbi:MAG: hypothetical protein PQJ46_10730, partial [Spirochaetales bacterium]|nr:hypothetical protein [Spirochaetales bacterium]